MTIRPITRILLTATCAPALGWAQNTAATSEGLEEVVITGSRIIQNGNDAPTPVTVVLSDQLQNGAPASMADALAQIPQFRSSSRPGSFLNSQNPTGAFLNLRGLGASRTLVLLDGRRTPPTTTEGRTDINTYPQLLMNRVDIVTGGASAAYGSDAVSGVVNFILDKQFTGIKGEAEAGISSRSDNESQRFGLAFGNGFAGGRGHFVGSVEYYNSEGIPDDTGRDWAQKHYNIIPNPNYPNDGRPANLWRSNVTGAQFSEGGLIYSGPLRGTQFLPGGVPGPFTFGTEVSGGTMIGGSGVWSPRSSVATPIKTLSTFGHVTFDVSSALSTFLEFGTSRTESRFNGTMPNWSGTTAFTIYNNNAYLPASIRTQMATANITSFTLGRLSNDWGPPNALSDTRTKRGAVGFTLKLGSGWTVDGSVDAGNTTGRLGNKNAMNQTKLFDAVDAVINPATGLPICRSTLTDPAHYCVPINILGAGSATQQALAYITSDEAWSLTEIKQTAASLSTRGELGSTWAGPIQLGAGLDYRRMSASQTADPGSSGLVQQYPGQRGLPASLVNKLGVYQTGNQFALPEVTQKVSEAYVETLLPLANDAAWAQNLDLNAAYRYAHYDTSGGVSSWKAGLTWQPTDWLRLRGTRSRDVRAPTLNDLYSPTTSSLGTIRDPVTGANNPVPGLTRGNPNLKPELANTWTFGVVLQPGFAPGLSVSLDFYDIKMVGAIGNLNRLTILRECASGATYYCQFVERLANGTLVSTTVSPQNLNSLHNSGADLEVNYRTDLAFMNLPGELRVRGLVAYLEHLATVDPFGTRNDQAGVNGGEAVGTPHWQGGLSVTYTLDNFSAFVQQRVIGGGRYSNNYVEGGTGANSIDFMQVDGRSYTDLTLKYKFSLQSNDFETFLTVNNAFDRDPPPSPTRVGTPVSILGTNPTLYDMVGRYYTVGVRFRF